MFQTIGQRDKGTPEGTNLKGNKNIPSKGKLESKYPSEIMSLFFKRECLKILCGFLRWGRGT